LSIESKQHRTNQKCRRKFEQSGCTTPVQRLELLIEVTPLSSLVLDKQTERWDDGSVLPIIRKVLIHYSLFVAKLIIGPRAIGGMSDNNMDDVIFHNLDQCVFYRGTTLEAAKAIVEEGFKVWFHSFGNPEDADGPSSCRGDESL
jgi:hypothetical protein